ncbi:MAG: DNA adenine methylase [Prosthecobacter sp.]|uniref:DNA adenine methylase n=1 Tax=Prosthecobacter sp. TaxID=1965333 RepID=UPI003BB12F7A
MTTKPPLRWPGGKTRLLTQLLPLIRPHTIFVEALIAQPGLTGLQQAARYLLRNRLSFGGTGNSFAVCRSHAQPSRAAVLDKLRALNARLDKVAVENISYERLFKNYDSPGTFWFCDPPYTVGEVDTYAAWDQERMEGFAQAVAGLQGDWLVTVNDTPENRALFRGHDIRPVVTNSGAVNRRTRPDATFGELIIRRRWKRASAAQALPLAA